MAIRYEESRAKHGADGSKGDAYRIKAVIDFRPGRNNPWAMWQDEQKRHEREGKVVAAAEAAGL